MITKAGKVVAINVLALCALLLVVEATLQGVALFRPSYDVLFLQPDRTLGWKLVPNHSFRWAGPHWYASDFSVAVSTNRHGFRDVEREHAKGGGVKRVALLGDSFVEAIQVPIEETAARVLEDSLNTDATIGGSTGMKWEVLNFGVSNFGVGQYLLAWNEQAAAFKPDYVAIFIAGFHMNRSVSKYERAVYGANATELNVRPTFRVNGSELTLEPAAHYQQFIDAQAEAIGSRFGGARSRRKTGWIMPMYASRIASRLGLAKAGTSPGSGVTAQTTAVNAAIVRELAAKVSSTGAKLVVMDVSQYFGDEPSVSSALAQMCQEAKVACVKAYEDLLKANRGGVATNWRHDNHFNAAGNRIFAQTLFAWIATQK
jgi:hypothetical protein